MKHVAIRWFLAASALIAGSAMAVAPKTPAQAAALKAAHAQDSLVLQQKARAARPITQLIVRYKDGTKVAAANGVGISAERLQALSARAGVALTYRRAMSGGAHVLALPKAGLSPAEAFAAAKRIESDGTVLYAQPDYWRYPSATPNDPLYAGAGNVPKGQWHYRSSSTVLGGLTVAGGANFENAWNLATGAGVVVAVIDTGYLPHVDLAANYVGGYDMISDVTIASDGDGRDADPTDVGDFVGDNECYEGAPARDSSWHGTHVAGTIAAVTNNGAGVAGGAFGAKFTAVRALGKCGGLTSDIADAMRWAAGLSVSGATANAHPAKVLNLSLGGEGECDAASQAAINDVRAAGAAIVIATGNDANPTAISSPANCAGVIAVTANTFEGDSATYANAGTGTTLSAPGGGQCTMEESTVFTCYDVSLLSGTDRLVWSTLNAGTSIATTDNYVGYNGTSMATPHVAAAAALLFSLQPALSPDEVSSLLASSSRPFPNGSYCDIVSSSAQRTCGAGMLDASSALARLSSRIPTVVASASASVVSAGTTVTLTGLATPNGGGSSQYAYSWTQLSGPTATLATPTAKTTTFTAPTPGGLMRFLLQVVDGNGYVSAATVDVRSNNAPVLTSAGGKSVQVGTALNFNVVATDADGDTVTYVATGVPTGASFSAATGAFSWPSPGPVGTYTMTVYAHDGYASSATATVTIAVTEGAGGGGGATGWLGLLMLAAAAWVLSKNRQRG